MRHYPKRYQRHRGVTESAMSNSAVRNICPRTWWTCSSIAFAWGFLTVVGLRFMPYESHRCSKCNLNSLPLSYVRVWHWRYLVLNQVSFTSLAILFELLSKMSLNFSSSLPFTIVIHSRLIRGTSTISNQLDGGSIMVRAIKLISELSLPLRVYGPIRSTHKHSKGCLWQILGVDAHTWESISY